MNGYPVRSLSGRVPYINVQERQPDGTSGGAFNSGAFRTRVLNTIQADTHNLVTLSSNQIILPAGTWIAQIAAPGWQVNDHQARLRDITNGVNLLIGTGARSSGSSSHERSEMHGLFVLSGPTVLEIQHVCETSNGVDGFGRVTNFTSDYELYTIAEFWKVA